MLARARVLDPRTGLFLQRDPAGYEDSVNLYALNRWDPVNLRDPTGRFVCGGLCIAGAITVGLAIWRYDDVVEGSQIINEGIADAAGAAGDLTQDVTGSAFLAGSVANGIQVGGGMLASGPSLATLPQARTKKVT